MEFFTQAVDVLGTIVIGIGVAVGIWGIVNLAEGYGNDNPGSKAQGVKQFVSGGGLILVGMKLIPLIAKLWN